jgi:hypothetical protein
MGSNDNYTKYLNFLSFIQENCGTSGISRAKLFFREWASMLKLSWPSAEILIALAISSQKCISVR